MIEQFEREIESRAVMVDVMLASTPASLLRRLEDNPILKNIGRELSVYPGHAERFLARAEALFAMPAEEGFLSDQDQALAAYLYLLGATAQAEAQSFIQRVTASDRADLRYARWMAEYWATKVAASRGLAGVA